jgi:hypothetical protein
MALKTAEMEFLRTTGVEVKVVERLKPEVLEN